TQVQGGASAAAPGGRPDANGTSAGARAAEVYDASTASSTVNGRDRGGAARALQPPSGHGRGVGGGGPNVPSAPSRRRRRQRARGVRLGRVRRERAPGAGGQRPRGDAPARAREAAAAARRPARRAAAARDRRRQPQRAARP